MKKTLLLILIVFLASPALANTAPIVENVSISSDDNNLNRTTANLIGSYDFFDADGDSDNSTYKWYNQTTELPGSFRWKSDHTVKTGLTDIGSWGKPTVFNDNGTLKLIIGKLNGQFNGFQWNGSQWVSNAFLVSGLGDVGNHSAPSVFNHNGTLKLIAGKEDGSFSGFQWNGTQWVSNSSIAAGLNVREHAVPSVYIHNGNLRLISGSYKKFWPDHFFGFQWNGTQWVGDSSLVSGLGDFTSTGTLGTYAAPSVFSYNNTLRLIAGKYDGTFSGYQWDGSQWVEDPSVATALGDTGQRNSALSVFNHNGKLNLIASDIVGVFYGFQLSPSLSSKYTSGGDVIVFEVTPYDGTVFGSPVNSSGITIIDVTAPVINDFSFSSSDVETGSANTITANCTDFSSISSVKAQITDPGAVLANETMSASTGDLYTVNYTPASEGTYEVKIFCTDSSGNVGNSSSDSFTASTPASGSSGGGGGGGSFPEPDSEDTNETQPLLVAQTPDLGTQIQDWFAQLIGGDSTNTDSVVESEGFVTQVGDWFGELLEGKLNITKLVDIFTQFPIYTSGSLAILAAGTWYFIKKPFKKTRKRGRRQ